MLSRVLLIRHGVTEMNEYLSTCPYGAIELEHSLKWKTSRSLRDDFAC